MPCNTDHMEPTVRERQMRNAAQVLLYVRTQRGKPVDDMIRTAANDPYGGSIHEDNVVRMLCEEFRDMSDREMNRIVYDGRNREARRAADWWEEHQEEDAKRLLIEQQAVMDAKYKDHVFVVFRNADMTEGRGPMVVDRVFKKFSDALTYMEGKSGVMGVKSPLKHWEQRTAGDRVTSPEHWSANDHDLRPMKVH